MMKELRLASQEYLPFEKLQTMHTKQLLKHYRSSFSWFFDYYNDECWDTHHAYQRMVKSILDKRENVLNKRKSKMLRKMKKKKGQKKEKYVNCKNVLR